MKPIYSGKAFEYAIVKRSAATFKIKIITLQAFDKAFEAFMRQDEKEQQKCLKAADEAIKFLAAHDKRFEKISQISLLSSETGKEGDVRDVIIYTTNNQEIGISAKNRHKAVKHSRLSGSIDFGENGLVFIVQVYIFEK